MVGLPAVALGRSPAFFREIWALSKGESWGVPLRFLFSALVFFVIAIPVMVLAMWPMISDFTELARTAESGPIPIEMIKTIMARLMPALIALVLIQIPFVWFSALLFAEAYRRFTARQVTRRR
jgi:predicted metal-binding membrane protein